MFLLLIIFDDVGVLIVIVQFVEFEQKELLLLKQESFISACWFCSKTKSEAETKLTNK